MAKQTPTKLILQYPDGTTQETAFDALPGMLQADILRQRFLLDASTAASGGAGKFVLLEWDDGWKEVFEVPAGAESIIRYYNIARQEDIGRLSFNVADAYPELIEVVRRPTAVKRIAFDASNNLEPGTTKREGKKTEIFYNLTPDGEPFAAEVAALRDLAKAEGIDLAAGLKLQGQELLTWLEDLRRKLNLAAGRKQQDVLDFVGYLAKAASAS